MMTALNKLAYLRHQLEQLNYVVNEVINYNESCFVDPLTSQVDTYHVRRQRCYKLMKAVEDQRKLDQLQITLENVSRQLVTSTHLTAALDECIKQVQVSVEIMETHYPKEEWINK